MLYKGFLFMSLFIIIILLPIAVEFYIQIPLDNYHSLLTISLLFKIYIAFILTEIVLFDCYDDFNKVFFFKL